MAVRVVLLRSFMGMEDLRPLFRYFRRSLGISAWSVYNRRREREAAVDGGVLGEPFVNEPESWKDIFLALSRFHAVADSFDCLMS